MSLLTKKTPEELEAEAKLKEQRQSEAEEKKLAAQHQKEELAFLATPVGQARLAFERGDCVFQYAIDVMNQKAVIVAMIGSAVTKQTSDPSEILNSVCREGWDLVNGGFVFVEEGQQSRDKFMSSGQNVATKGVTMGYYLFRRCEENRSTCDAG